MRYAIIIVLLALPASAQQVVTDNLVLSPVSRTAFGIGGLHITRDTMISADGIDRISLVGSYWRDWDGDGEKDTADLFSAPDGPLCDGHAAYFAVHRTPRGYGISAFSGDALPKDVNSSGLCATYSYD